MTEEGGKALGPEKQHLGGTRLLATENLQKGDPLHITVSLYAFRGSLQFA